MRIKYLIILVLFFLVPLGCTKQSDSLYLENAELSQIEKHSDYLQQISRDEKVELDNDLFVVTGHRIEKGSGTVLALRIFDKGPLTAFYTDKASFEKVTIYLPFNITEEKRYKITPDSGIIAFYSRGNSSFPGQSGCFGYAQDGFIRLRRIVPKKLSADITLKIDLINPAGLSKDCNSLDYRRVVELRRKTVADITTWEGEAGTHIYDESFRKRF